MSNKWWYTRKELKNYHQKGSLITLRKGLSKERGLQGPLNHKIELAGQK